jgi:hypothetical protein
MKGLRYLLVAFFITVVSFSISAQTKILMGSWSFTKALPAYSLDQNNGERSMTIKIDFKKSFSKIPEVILSVTQIDADRLTNIRYKVDAISVSRDGFTLKANTWADSKIFSISGSWLAYLD